MRSSRTSSRSRTSRTRPAPATRWARFALLAAAVALPWAAAAGSGEAVTGDDWRVFAPEGGRFRVELPAEPSLERDARSTPVGAVHETKYWLRSGDAELAVETHDVPAIAAAVMPAGSILDQARDGVIEHEGGTPIESREVELHGAPGREFAYTLPGEPRRIERARSVLVGRRLYLLTHTSDAGEDDPEIERFFASFRFWKAGEEPR